jgi:hypothetical protein
VFANSRLLNVTIGANVPLGSSTIGSGFEDFYNRNGKLAGTYLRRDSSSSTWVNNREELGFDFDTTTGTITGYIGDTGRITIPEAIGGIPVTAIGNGAFNLPGTSGSVIMAQGEWGDPSGYSAGETSVVIQIGRGIKFDNSAFTGSTFNAFYSRHGRRAGTYSYTYTSNKVVRNVFLGILTPTIFLTILPAWLIPYGEWKWYFALDKR